MKNVDLKDYVVKLANLIEFLAEAIDLDLTETVINAKNQKDEVKASISIQSIVDHARKEAEQAPVMELVGWQFYENGQWINGDQKIKDHRKNTESAGILTRNVYAEKKYNLWY